jgi:hypothetical protein
MSLSGCEGECSGGTLNVTLSQENEAVQSVELITSEGQTAGFLEIPVGFNNGNGELEVTFLVNENPIRTQLSNGVSSPVVDINLRSEDGSVIEDLDRPLTICLTVNPGIGKNGTSGKCLGYFDTKKQKWRCEDCSLKRQTSKEGQSVICGRTPHLTSFALLLTGNSGGCGEQQMDKVLSWLSLAFICLAIVVVLIGLVLIEVRHRYHLRKLQTQLTKFDHLNKA